MVSPIRLAFALSDPRRSDLDFTGATTIRLNTVNAGDTVSFYKATVAPGTRFVGVDWCDGNSWGDTVDNPQVEVVYPGAGGEIVLSHTYKKTTYYPVVKITNGLSELRFSGVTLTGVGRTTLSISPFEGARRVSGIDALGSNIENRTLTRGMFANTSITEIPSMYSFGDLSPLAASPCVPLACFYGCSKLASVRALSGVVAIDARAFEGCTSLQSVSQFSASSLVHIGYRAFAGCTNLTSLDGLTGTLTKNAGAELFGREISSFTSAEKASLFSALDPEGSRNFRVDQFMLPVGRGAFQGCTKLTDISALKFSGGIILPDTFDRCSSLATVPAGVKNCYYGSGHEGNGMPYAGGICLLAGDTVVMSSDDNYFCIYGSQTTSAGLDAWISGGAFTNTKVTEIVGVPRGRRAHIANGEFSGCSALTSITIASVDRLGYNAFSGCTGLADVTFTGRTKESVKGIHGLYDLCYAGYSVESCPFGLPVGCIIHCSDGDLRVVSSSSVEDV